VKTWIEAARIAAFSTGAAILYGLIHDQVTAHLCVEYFSVAHPPVFPTESPFLLAIGWGIIATWWVGLSLGLALAAAALIGPAPRLGLADLRKPIILLMAVSGVAAILSGALGALLVASGFVPVPGGWGDILPPAKHIAFTADAWAHLASYGVGFLGGVFLIARSIWLRVRAR
jgi:hypothetical protein